jgi:hypothetical protein
MEQDKNLDNNERKIWWTVTINLYALYKYFPNLDIIDAVLLYYLRDICNSRSKSLLRKSKDGKEFTWVAYKHILEQVPSLRITSKEGIRKRFLKLVKLGLFEYFVEDGKLFVAPTELLDILVFARANKGVNYSLQGCQLQLTHPSTQVDTPSTTVDAYYTIDHNTIYQNTIDHNTNKAETLKQTNQVICWFCGNPKNKKDCLQSSPTSYICKECYFKKRQVVMSKKQGKQEKTPEKALKKEEKLYEIENSPVFNEKEQSEMAVEVAKEERKEKRKGEKQAKGEKESKKSGKKKENLDIWDIPY